MTGGGGGTTPADGGVVGTSTRWKGPNGDLWSSAASHLARWDDESPNADQRLEEIAADHLRALHETLRVDRAAFSLYDTACAAGERLAGALGALAVEGAQSEYELVARLVSTAGGDRGTLADAAVRRGLAAAVRDVRVRHPELDDAMGEGSAGSASPGTSCAISTRCFSPRWWGSSSGLLSPSTSSWRCRCWWRPIRKAGSPDWVAEKLVDLVPNPCEESTEATDLAQAVDTARSVAGAVEDPSAVLPKIAEALVPRAVRKVLGLITEEIVGDEGAAA
ncbi:hypothetical protein [Streptomyces sp. NPDC056683]|uniref:hypothetical protein n=1 Tax=Streptomyces sp. NPDC056683 TaxID=3345910 RepID=UPI0036C7BA90